MKTQVTAFLASVALAATTSHAVPVIDHSVHRALAQDGKVNLVIRMKSNANVVENFKEAEFVSRTDKANALKSELERASAEALAPLGEVFTKESASISDIKTYWIAPMAYVKDASESVVKQIAAIPNVESVRAERRIPLIKPILESDGAIEAVQGTEWNIQRIQAPQVWADGISGQSILVGSIDTGVHGTHEALAENFVGPYGWFDPELKTAAPHDDNGHGTHTMSTIAGRKGVGVAPGAKWMSCRGCRTEDCPESDLLTCAQWVFCPTDTNGNNPDCSKAPRLVSNSWGGGQGDLWYKDVIDAWIKSGIVPIFANGNEGPDCSTVSSPGDYPNVIGVGATTLRDGLAGFSSKGPSVNGRMKPDISAPGARVRAAWNTSDSSYLTISGTSMATPHVAGSVALLLSAEPGLSIDDIKVRLYTTADQSNLGASNYTCGGTPDSVWPNNQYGHGRLNIYSAYRGYRVPVPAPTPTPAPTKSANETICNQREKLWCKFNANPVKCDWSDAKNICTVAL